MDPNSTFNLLASMDEFLVNFHADEAAKLFVLCKGVREKANSTKVFKESKLEFLANRGRILMERFRDANGDTLDYAGVFQAFTDGKISENVMYEYLAYLENRGCTKLDYNGIMDAYANGLLSPFAKDHYIQWTYDEEYKMMDMIYQR